MKEPVPVDGQAMPEHGTDHTPNTDTALWRFSLALWHLPRASELCLSLQQQGWSVTRLLCAGWLARERRIYPASEPAALSQWRTSVTTSIRALKKSLAKSDQLLTPLRQALARAELEAERIELYKAWQAVQDAAPASADTNTFRLTEQNLRRAAPPSGAGLNDTTEPMIRQLAELINLADLPAGSGQPATSRSAPA